mmetsp:Transcript_10489/g.17592  ORF Transcript_10489/g.17592 Transcript_10489/m.17592 type:complete len:108 (-) Transcript_10489:21-344(-)
MERELKLQSLPYLTKVCYLQRNFKEEWLRENFMPKKMRCKNKSQSYSVHGNLTRFFGGYSGVQNSSIVVESCQKLIERSELILQDPFMDEIFNKNGDPRLLFSSNNN